MSMEVVIGAEKASKPPGCNTGVLNTSPSPLRPLIDWVRVTFKTLTLHQVFELLSISEDQFVDMPKGLYSYTKRKDCGHIRILYEGAADMGIHVELTGQGCREYETFYSFGDEHWETFFGRCMDAGGSFSRLDCAVDDIRYSGERPFFTIQKIIRKVKRMECRSKFRKALRIEKIDIAVGESKGQTIKFGSDTSDVQIRMYQKDYERMDKGIELEQNVTAWNRTEIELSDDRADRVVELILLGAPIGDVVQGVLCNYLEFVDRTSDTNRARWPRSEFWDKYIGDVKKLRLASAAPDKTIEESKAWLENQVAPTLGMIFYAGESSIEYIVELINNGLERMSDAQLQKAEEYLERLKAERKNMNEKKKERVERFKERIQKRRAEVREGVGRMDRRVAEAVRPDLEHVLQMKFFDSSDHITLR